MAIKETMRLTDSLQRCKEYLRRHIDKGVKCPCCNQTVKLNRVVLNRRMVFALNEIHKATLTETWCHVPTQLAHLQRLRVYPKLSYWGLIESMVDVAGFKDKNKGYWRVTDKGYGFLLRGRRVPAYLKLYNRKIAGKSDDSVTCAQAYGDGYEGLVIPDFEDTNP